MSISVVIPAYNASRFIAETIASVLAQTLPPLEVLVVDDGSTDHTAAIAERFGAPVQVLKIANSKLSAARNYGVHYAAGEWIAFIDADDLWAPNKLERQMQELAAQPEADLCYTGRVLLQPAGDRFETGRVVETPSAEMLDRWLMKDTSFPPSSVVVRRAVLVAAGGFDPKIRFVEDWDMWMRLYLGGCRFVACPEPLLLYRVHDGNMSLSALGILNGVDDVYRKYIRPRIPWYSRLLHHGRFWSRHEAEAAFALRSSGDRRCLAMMARSIAHWPFDDPARYKVLAHMMYVRLRGGPTAT